MAPLDASNLEPNVEPDRATKLFSRQAALVLAMQWHPDHPARARTTTPAKPLAAAGRQPFCVAMNSCRRCSPEVVAGYLAAPPGARLLITAS